MPLLQTFRSLFLRVPPADAEPLPIPAVERRWPPSPRNADWDTVPTSPPAECGDSVLGADATTLDRDTADAGPSPMQEIAPPPGPWIDEESSVRDEAPRSSVACRAVGPVIHRPIARSIPESERSRPAPTPIPDSIRADFPDHSAAAGAVWPDDEEQAAVSKRSAELSKVDQARGGIAITMPASSRRARPHVFALTGELPIARFE